MSRSLVERIDGNNLFTYHGVGRAALGGPGCRIL